MNGRHWQRSAILKIYMFLIGSFDLCIDQGQVVAEDRSTRVLGD